MYIYTFIRVHWIYIYTHIIITFVRILHYIIIILSSRINKRQRDTRWPYTVRVFPGNALKRIIYRFIKGKLNSRFIRYNNNLRKSRRRYESAGLHVADAFVVTITYSCWADLFVFLYIYVNNVYVLDTLVELEFFFADIFK